MLVTYNKDSLQEWRFRLIVYAAVKNVYNLYNFPTAYIWL